MSSEETKQKIMVSAFHCFTQYGFSKTSMSLVSEVSGFSRVTVYKFFQNKTVLFRCVVADCLETLIQEAHCRSTLLEGVHPWQMIEEYLIAVGRPAFESVSSDYVLKDLNDHLYDIAEDIVLEKKQKTVTFIRQQLELGREQGVIDLQALEVSSLNLACLIDQCFVGIMRTASVKDIKCQLHNLVRVFRTATQVNL